MLATYLSGLALGSFLFARLGGSAPDPWRTLGVLLAAAGTSALGIVALVGPWLPDAQTFAGMWAMRATGRETVEVGARFVVAAAVVLLLPTTFLGAAFPAAARLVASADRVGRDVGTTLALNTAGGIVGTLVTGFVLVPWLGLVRTLAALAVAGALLGALAVLRGGRERTGAWLGAAAMVLAAAVLGLMTPRDKLATPWATVTLDGQDLGETPVGNTTVAIGTHEVVFRHPQLGEQRFTATVTAMVIVTVMAAVRMKLPQAQKALAAPAVVVVIMPRRSRPGMSRRVRRSRVRPARAKAFKASPFCIARAVRIPNPTVPIGRSAKPRSIWRKIWLKKS